MCFSKKNPERQRQSFIDEFVVIYPKVFDFARNSTTICFCGYLRDYVFKLSEMSLSNAMNHNSQLEKTVEVIIPQYNYFHRQAKENE